MTIMDTNNFIKLIISSDSTGGETLEIHYKDGTSVEGWVQRVDSNFTPPFVNFCKNVSQRGQSSDHTINFDKIEKIIVKRYNQQPVTYSRD
jgi:hypothetical protein